MARLELTRDTPLTDDERAALPAGVDDPPAAGAVASAAAPDDPAALVGLAVLLARAVPTASVRWVETALQAPRPEPVDPSEPPPPAATGPLSTDGRDAVRRLLQSTNPSEAVDGCRRAQAAEWRSAVTLIRRLLTHSDTRVRLAAVQAIGALAGPGLVPALRRLESDPSPDVQAAATAAIATLDG